MKWLPISWFFLFYSLTVFAQDNYEIQVYGSGIVEQKATSIELHSNFTTYGHNFEGTGVLPSTKQIHETIEITHGFSTWFETGMYLFTALNSNGIGAITGSNIRPRVTAPDKWGIPFGLSLSSEIGYMAPAYAEDDWSMEIRLIMDKKWGKFYCAINPVLDKVLHGPSQSKGFAFVPNAKFGYDLFKKATFGIEYYADLGEMGNFDAIKEQHHQLFIAVDALDWIKNLEFNAGYGIGLTPVTDNGIIKLIIGYKFGKKETKEVGLNKSHPVGYQVAKK